MSRKTLRGKRGSWKNMQNLDRLFNQQGRKRGRLNEGIVGEILAELKGEGAIVGFIQDWNLDRVGIDHLIYLLDGEIVAIQEKSSLRGKQAHYEKYGTYVKFKNQNTRCLVLVINTEHLVDRTSLNSLKNDIKNFIDRRD